MAAAAASGTAVEISSSGLYKPVGEIYPAPLLLQMFHDAAVPIVFASDAHEPSHCGRNVDQLVTAARNAGYTEYLAFDQRKSTTQGIPAIMPGA